MQKDYLTIPQAARLCDVNRSTMWRWVKDGYVKSCLTLGGQHRIRKADLDTVLTENQAYRVPGADLELTKQPSAHAASHPPKILIVDDDPQILKMMRKRLTNQGYETAAASDGFEVCKRIKGNTGTSHIKVLAVSGYDTEENREKIFKAGADGFLPKPIDMEAILNEVKQLCQVSESLPEKAAAAG